jgi:hypothetical protein
MSGGPFSKHENEDYGLRKYVPFLRAVIRK